MGKWILILAIFGLAGCNSALEDGYKPKKLGASDAVRRSYYASPFTPEAKVAQSDQDQEMGSRRPHPGY
jgi:hypothetical protein